MYVPPHPLNIDFPHLMLRYKIIEANPNMCVPLPPEQYVDLFSGKSVKSGKIEKRPYEGVLDQSVATKVKVEHELDRNLHLQQPGNLFCPSYTFFSLFVFTIFISHREKICSKIDDQYGFHWPIDECFFTNCELDFETKWKQTKNCQKTFIQVFW